MENRTDNQTALAALDRGLSRIDPSLWIAHRQKTLKAEASHMRSGINTAKTLSLGSLAATGGLGLLFGATGIGLVGGGIAGLTYAAVVVCDLLDTDRFAPLPFIRTNLGDRLETLGNADSRALRAEWELAQRGTGKSSFEAEEELYSNLPRELSDEAMMLTKHGALLATLLSQLPFEQRDLAYVRLCASYQTFGDALTGMSLARLQDLVEGRVRGNYLEMKPADIHSYQAPVYQMPDSRPFGALPETLQNFGALPAEAPAPMLGGTVGNTTRLGALNVPAISPTPTANRTVSDRPSFLSDGQVSPQFLQRPMAQRADTLIQYLKADGCDIEQFIGDQILGTTGVQRAGKTTLLLILSILEMAKGKRLTYVTIDDDLYPIAFTQAAWGEEGTAGYEQFLKALPNLSKGAHCDEIWFLDECTKATSRLGPEASEELWNGLLTGFIKTGMSVRLVCHGTTAKAMGIPNGLVGQAKDESTFVKAMRARDVLDAYEGAGKYPSGEYRGLACAGATYSETSARWQLPQWLLFDTNSEGQRCYVHSLLRLFPELDTRVTGQLPPRLVTKKQRSLQLEDAWTDSRAEVRALQPTKAAPLSPWAGFKNSSLTDCPPMFKLMNWIEGKRQFKLREAHQHQATSRALDAIPLGSMSKSEVISSYVNKLADMQMLERIGPDEFKLSH